MRTLLLAALLSVAFSARLSHRTGATDLPADKATQHFGVLAGRIFLITKGGDLKPARMARLYLLWNRGPGTAAITAAGGGDTPGLFYLKKYLEETQKAKDSGTSAYCLSGLVSADKAMVSTLNWAQAHKLTAYVVAPEVDEEGRFTARNIRPGIYEIIARGRAGTNDAYWLGETNVKAGERTKIKLDSVEVACVDVT